MLANNYPNIKEAVTTIYQLIEDEKIRQMCERREKALFIERSREHLISEQKKEISQLSSENTQLAFENERLKKLLTKLNTIFQLMNKI